MPKRAIDFDPTKSDSQDSDFDVNADRPSRSSRAAKKASRDRSKPARKKRRTSGYDGMDSDIVNDEDSLLSDESFGDDDDDDDDEEEPEIDPRTGRPVRRSVNKKVVYEESDDDSADFMDRLNSDDEDQEGVGKLKRKSEKLKKAPARKQLIVKLKTTPVARRTRGQSITGQTERPGTATLGTRRSSRIAHDDTENLFALTNSGHHQEVVRPGTESPPPMARRSSRGGKGMKKPPSDIVEASHESSNMTKTDLDDNNQAVISDDELDKPNVAETGVAEQDVEMKSVEEAPVPESEDDDEEAVRAKPRTRRKSTDTAVPENPEITVEEVQGTRSSRRAALRSLASRKETPTTKRKRSQEESSDFEPAAEEEAEGNASGSDSDGSPHKDAEDSSDDNGGNRRRTRGNSHRPVTVERESEEADELAEELQALREDSRRPRRRARAALADLSADDRPQTRKRKPVDYRILRPELALPVDDDAPASAITPSRRGRGAGPGGWRRDLFSTHGPFGGGGGPPPVFGGPGGLAATGGVDSDSSDDEVGRPRAGNIGGMVGMTPTSAAPAGFGAFPAGQTHNSEALQASLGKIKDKKELADADPLGVDQNVNFDGVGGLQGHIDQLKEMVALPLLYPEVFQRFKVTPPRGVLFHGPPGTGKTLMARALATSVSTEGRKVTFYMRKGADALSKWVGEAERQLRQLFEEARKNQPSIIFFDEIDGLAPVRSSKQEQIHASIVSTLLALMDGMDGRGQVIVIGATNRPDSVDPALRRPGRFDREFYFPLPNKDARLKILEIHTKGWEPPLPASLRHEIAEVTKGYGGADLRGLCTEAALNAVQRRYPQIYRSDRKLMIKPETIEVSAKDFMLSIKKIVPSSERAATSGAAPLPKNIDPLLHEQLLAIERIINEILPHEKVPTALQEAEFESHEGAEAMRMERMQQDFERARIFRPRLLIRGGQGMGQQYLASALLARFEGLHVQSFDLPTLMSDSTRSAEAAVVQLFAEVKRHKPSVIYIPNVDTWYNTLADAAISTFKGLLRSLNPTEPVLLLGVLENPIENADQVMLRDFFGYSKRNQFEIPRPSRNSRKQFFRPIVEYLDHAPNEFPNPLDRKKRVLEELPVAPPPPPKLPPPLSEAEIRAQRKKDKVTLNMLKSRLHPIMEQIRTKYRLFRNGVIEDSDIKYLYDEENPNIVTSDIPQDELHRIQATFRPYEKDKDKHGHPGLREVASNRFFYNMDSVTIQNRLQNGYYKRPKDFLADIKKLTKDARTVGDEQRLLKASELQSNVEVDLMTWFDTDQPAFVAECEAVYQREQKREKELFAKAAKAAAEAGRKPPTMVSALPPNDNSNDSSKETLSGPVMPHKIVTNGDGPVTGTIVAAGEVEKDSTLTNGTSDLSRGPNVTGHHSSESKQEDVQMSNSDERRETQSDVGPSAQARPEHLLTGPPYSLQHRLSQPGSLSQRSAITPMAEGTTPAMYENLASSTSSEKRHTGSSGETQQMPHSAPPFSNGASQEHDEMRKSKADTNMDISMIVGEMASNSQLPSTQGTQSHSGESEAHHLTPLGQQNSNPISQQDSNSTSTNGGFSRRQTDLSQQQTPSAPRFPNNILSPNDSRPELHRDRARSSAFLDQLAQATGGCSIEQLEQVYSALMNELWRTRGQWDRLKALDSLHETLKDILMDMDQCQELASMSHENAGMDRQRFLSGSDANYAR